MIEVFAGITAVLLLNSKKIYLKMCEEYIDSDSEIEKVGIHHKKQNTLINTLKYHIACTDGKIPIRINLLFYLCFPP